MNVLVLIIPLSLILGTIFVVCFIMAAKSGQYDDLDTPAYRLLIEDEKKQINDTTTTQQRKKK